MAEATFPERPDTVRPGSLRGPFDGRVVEQQNGNPIASALVIGSWSYERPGPLPQPAGAQTVSVLTRSDGGYELPAARVPSGTVLSHFVLLVYKAGFLGYRSDQRYDDRAPRRDFAQRRHVIRLDRFPEGESHARHLAFLGGEGTLRRAAQAEIVQAALELSEAQPPPRPPKEELPPPPLPDPRALLPQAEVEALVQGQRFSAEALDDNLGGERSGPSYGGVHYRAAGRPESFDAGLRVWRVPDPAALLERMQQALPGAREAEGAGDRAIIAYDSKRRVRGAAALIQDKGLVLQLVCGASLCPKEEDLRKLLGQVLGRLESEK